MQFLMKNTMPTKWIYYWIIYFLGDKVNLKQGDINMKIVSILNEKGGVGKTQTTINLAVGSSRLGHKVLVIDCDPQANASQYFKTDNKQYYLENMLLDSKLSRAYKTQYENVDIIPCTKSLALSVQQIAELKNKNQLECLKDILEELPMSYDLVIVDLLPTLNLLTTNSLYISDLTISPTTIDTEGIAGLFSTRDNIIQLSNDYSLDIDHVILFNKVQIRSKIDTGLIEDLKNAGFKSFEQVIRYQNAPMKRASLKLQPVINSVAKTNKVGNDFRELVSEFVERVEV